MGERAGRAVRGIHHPANGGFHVFVELLAQARQKILRGDFFKIAELFARNGGNAARERQFQNFAAVEPAVGGVGVVLAANQRFLTAGNAGGFNVLGRNAFLGEDGEERIVVEERRRENPGGEEEPPKLRVKAVGSVFMELDRKDRLGQVHFIVGVEERIGRGVGQVVPVNVAPAHQQVLRDRPAAVGHVEEHQKMAEERGGVLAREAVAVRLEDAVRVADGEGIGVGSLLDAHDFPQDHEALNGLVKVARAVARNAGQRRGNAAETGRFFRVARFFGGRLFLGGNGAVAVGQKPRAIQRVGKGQQVVGALGVGLGGRFLFCGADQIERAVLQGGSKLGNQMPRDLLHKVDHLARVAFGGLVHGRKLADVGGVQGILAKFFNALFRELLVGVNVAEHRGRVAVAREGLHAERGVDERVGARERVALRTRENGVFRNGERQGGQLLAEQGGGCALGGKGAVFLLLARGGFADPEPAGQFFDAPFLAEQGFREFNGVFCVLVHDVCLSIIVLRVDQRDSRAEKRAADRGAFRDRRSLRRGDRCLRQGTSAERRPPRSGVQRERQRSPGHRRRPGV